MADDGTDRRVDLNAARAARAGKKGQAPRVDLGDRQFLLPAELPVEVITAFGMMQQSDLAGMTDAVGALFGDQWAEVKKLGFSVDDLLELLSQIMPMYGFTVPESLASAGS